MSIFPMISPPAPAAAAPASLPMCREVAWDYQNNRPIFRRGEPVTVTGREAVRQAVEIILHVERFRWQIYKPYSGMEWEGLIGQDPGYVGAELQRRLVDALTIDDRVTGISNYEYTVDGNSLYATFTVDTVYGSFDESQEVTLA